MWWIGRTNRPESPGQSAQGSNRPPGTHRFLCQIQPVSPAWFTSVRGSNKFNPQPLRVRASIQRKWESLPSDGFPALSLSLSLSSAGLWLEAQTLKSQTCSNAHWGARTKPTRQKKQGEFGETLVLWRLRCWALTLSVIFGGGGPESDLLEL